MDRQIREVNISYDSLKRKKTWVIISFALYMTAGLAMIAAGCLLYKYIFSKGFISTIPLLILGAGLAAIPVATGRYIGYRQKLRVALEKKTSMDALLELYNTRYDIAMDVTTDVHGNEHYKTKITYTRKHYR